MTVMLPGLRDHHEAQYIFRSLLNALATPGRPQHLLPPQKTQAKHTPSHQAPTAQTQLPQAEDRYPASMIGLLSLLDATVTVGFPAVLDDLERWLVFHTETSIVPMHRADFIYVPQYYPRPALNSLRQGTLAAPETSATLILDVSSFSEGDALELTGSGIQTIESIAPTLDPDFVSEWQKQSELFPRGIDTFLMCGAQVIGLPRSTKIRRA